MRIYFFLDEKNRINGMYATTEEPTKEEGISYIPVKSYLEIRKMFREIGEIMGLETITARIEGMLLEEKRRKYC